MGKKIDAVGKVCPMPVILAKKEMDEGETNLEIRVDQQIAVENLTRLAESRGYSVEISGKDGGFTVFMEKNGTSREAIQEREESSPKKAKGSYTILVDREGLGDGDPKLAKQLIRMFFYTLTQSGTPPECVIFLNGGVKLAALDEEIKDHLKSLTEQGVDVLVCGTCLNYFGITEQLGAGRVSNMYEITERLQEAEKVITL